MTVQMMGRILDYPTDDVMTDVVFVSLRHASGTGKSPGTVVMQAKRMDAEGLLQKRKVRGISTVVIFERL